MNPQTPQSPQPSPEQPQGQSPEQATGAAVPELTVQPAPVADGQPPAATPTLSASDVAAAIASMPAPTAPAVASLPLPLAAADEDLIETEWVTKTEEVIAQTSGNPYAEEEAIEDLQIDYLQKRYGYQVKKPEDK